MAAARLRILALSAAMLAPFASAAPDGAPAETPAAKRPNILFFITDDQFKDMMNWLPEGAGQNLTPETDRLAAGGTVMARQYVTSPVCTPSRYACLTGQYPSRSTEKSFVRTTKQNGGQAVVQWNTFIRPGQLCLPSKLREAGYFTGFVGKNHVVDSEYQSPGWKADPLDEKTKSLLAENARRQAETVKSIGFDFAASLYHNNPAENGVQALASHNLDWIAKGALDFLSQTGDKPFFLYLATTVPHGPAEPDRSWNADRRITSEGLTAEPLAVLPDKSTFKDRLKAAGIKGSQKENLLWMDDLLAAVVNKLKETGQLDNTIILYFNDNGQKAKGTIYDGGVHCESFVWRQGGFPAGHICEVPVSNIDFAPTLLDLAGVKYDPSDFDGRSFAPVLMGEKPADRPLFFELGYVRGVRLGDWKYIALRYPKNATEMTVEKRQAALEEFNADQERKGRPVYTRDPMKPFSHVMLVPGGGDAEHMSMESYPGFYDADQLYNIAEDPDEQHNLAGEPAHNQKLEEMKKLLQKQLADLPGTFGEIKTD